MGRVTLRLHDTAARAVRDFVPLEEGRAGIYVCGLTVQSEPHVGHVRSAVNFDVLQRWLRHGGYEMTFIRNTTDIDDKILVKAAEDGSGDVYFDVRSWPSYGELTHQKIDDMEAAEDADLRGKRDPRDFALWKGWKKEREPETAA